MMIMDVEMKEDMDRSISSRSGLRIMVVENLKKCWQRMTVWRSAAVSSHYISWREGVTLD